MNPIEVAVIGTGWCGGIRAETLAAHALVSDLHIAEVKQERLAELKTSPKARTTRSRATASTPGSTSSWKSRSR
jgi:myo-inositol 2-dehydrogenase/D-chiro-inositol 1-dehydrogenase